LRRATIHSLRNSAIHRGGGGSPERLTNRIDEPATILQAMDNAGSARLVGHPILT